MKSSVLLLALALGTAATSWATVTSCAGQSSATLPSAGENGNTPANGCGQIDSGFNNLTTPAGPDGNGGVFNNFITPPSPIFVNNFSFETLPAGGLPEGCGVGCTYSTGAIPGWSGGTGLFGQFQPGTPWFTTPPSDGSATMAWSQGLTIAQTVLPTVQLGVTYTLMVDLGLRLDPGPTFVSSAGLLVDDVRLDETVPEPTGATLLGLGLVGLSVFARWKRVS